MPPVGEFQQEHPLHTAPCFPQMIPALLQQFLNSPSWARLQAGPWTPWDCTWTEQGCGSGHLRAGVPQLFSDSDGLSNLLYRVKLREYPRNHSFYRSCGDNQDTGTVNRYLHTGQTRLRRVQSRPGGAPHSAPRHLQTDLRTSPLKTHLLCRPDPGCGV